MKKFLPVLRPGSTSIVGHTYGVDEDVPLPVPVGSRGSRSPRNPSSMTTWWWRRIPAELREAYAGRRREER
jgi:hypothetical protein